jgi:SAM-dependent methyltransferase
VSLANFARVRSTDSDETWRYYGKTDPYFGVLTQDAFRSENLTAEARARFFQSGDSYVDFVLATIRDHLTPSFEIRRALDFGCGVGRLTIPLARASQSVTGVDVSEWVLDEAARNCRAQGITNVKFVPSDDALTAVTQPVDFVHSFIVLQHIPPVRGEAIFRRLIDILEDGGVGAVHFTCSWSSQTPLYKRLLAGGYLTVPGLFGIRNVLKGRPFGERLMEMNCYDVTRLMRILHEAGCHRVHVRFTETDTYGQPLYGVILFFQKTKMDVRAFG